MSSSVLMMMICFIFYFYSIPTSKSSISFVNNESVINFTVSSLNPGYYNVSCKFENRILIYADELMFIYNKTAITFTSVSPHSIERKMKKTVVVTGRGFINTSDILCVTSNGLTFKAEFKNPTQVLCLIPAIETTARLFLAISFSRNDRYVRRDKGVNFTIYANASRPISSQFTDHLNEIEIKFDVPTQPKIVSDECSMFFHQRNVTSFGANAKCVFTTPLIMLIQLRGHPTILPHQTLYLKRNSISRMFHKVTKESTLLYYELTVSAPKNPSVLQASLIGTTILGKIEFLI